MLSFRLTIFILFVHGSLRLALQQTVDLRCTKEFCEEYVEKCPCPQMEPSCLNRTVSTVLPSPTVCNCCEHCFLFLEIGDSCIEGSPGQSLPNVICKPGTECISGVCQEKITPDAALFPGYVCEGDMCTCAVLVNDKILKIFGQFPAATVNITTGVKQCGCSIFSYQAQETIQQILSFPDLQLPVPRCLANGQFDSLQCNEDMCGCVDAATGAWDSSVRKVAIGTLGPGNPKCFDPKRHKQGEYYTLCERERNDLRNEIFWGELENIIIILSHKVECTPDGRYAG